MLKSRILRRTSIALAFIVLAIGLLAFTWNIIYDNHNWNHLILKENHYTDGILGMLFIALISLTLFLTIYFLLRKKLKNKSGRIISITSFILYNAAAVATIIIVCCASVNLGRDYKDYCLDRHLASENKKEVHEAIDSIIARTHNHDLYCSNELNEFIMKEARNGYAPAQNYVGVYFHEKAKEKNDRNIGYDKWDCYSTDFCQEELTRATYWWLKAAEQDYGRAQENLGRMKMNLILTNQPYSYGEAKYWLIKAAKNGITSAYYYLGLLSQGLPNSESANYWKMGAGKGNEDCMRMLENPDFIDISVKTETSLTTQ